MQTLTRLVPSRARLPLFFAIALAVGLAAGISAAVQERPNFTGTWTVDLKSSQLHEDFRALEAGTYRIDHREPEFRFHRTFIVKGNPAEASYEITTNGQETRSVDPNGGATVATMNWDGSALVIHQRISHPKAGELNNKVRYELVDKGRTLRATEDFEGAGRSHHNIWILRRQ